MEGILKFLFDVVIWVLVPAIILTVLYFTRSSFKRPGHEKDASSIRSGFWAGFVLFLIVLVYKVGFFLKEGFPNNEIYQGFNIWIVFVASVVVLLLMMAKRKVKTTRTTGLATLSISFAGFYALVDYLFIREYNELLLSLTLGVAFGALLNFASSPSSFSEFFSFRRRRL